MIHRIPFWVILFTILLVFQELSAQTPLRKRVGIGFCVGEPTAVTMRFRVGRASSVDIAAGKAVTGYPRIHMDYHWQHTTAFANPEYSLYSGIGAAVGFGEKGEYFLFKTKADSSTWFHEGDVALMGRGTIGFNILPSYTPIEIFIEANPLVAFVPKLALDFEASIGIRYYP